jgi:hypothetical protein
VKRWIQKYLKHTYHSKGKQSAAEASSVLPFTSCPRIIGECVKPLCAQIAEILPNTSIAAAALVIDYYHSVVNPRENLDFVAWCRVALADGF